MTDNTHRNATRLELPTDQHAQVSLRNGSIHLHVHDGLDGLAGVGIVLDEGEAKQLAALLAGAADGGSVPTIEETDP